MSQLNLYEIKASESQFEKRANLEEPYCEFIVGSVTF